ncbi:MAG: 30S ribosomal protein S20 [Rubrobacteraceae bacterium]
MPAPSKRDKQSIKRYEQNRTVRARLRNLSKNFYRAVDTGDSEGAREIRDESQKAYDKAAVKGIIHPNKASRKVSRFDKALAGSNSES